MVRLPLEACHLNATRGPHHATDHLYIECYCRRCVDHPLLQVRARTAQVLSLGWPSPSHGCRTYGACSECPALLAVVLACRSVERGERLQKALMEEGAQHGKKPSLEV